MLPLSSKHFFVLVTLIQFLVTLPHVLVSLSLSFGYIAFINLDHHRFDRVHIIIMVLIIVVLFFIVLIIIFVLLVVIFGCDLLVLLVP